LFDELPPAKLYLDDVLEIVSILTKSDAPSKFSVSFSVDSLRCDTVEDLQQIGGRTIRFRIDVTETLVESGIPHRSWLRIESVASYLALSCSSEGEFWTKRGKVLEIFESNSIPWRRAIQGALKRIPLWAVGILFFVLFLVRSTPLSEKSVHLSLWTLAGAVLGVVPVYLCLFRHSVVILRYAHEHGTRKWLRVHSAQILFMIAAAILGAIAKGVVDRLWPSHR
jgi:hypothetical protein